MSNELAEDLSLLQREPALVSGVVVAVVGVLGAAGLQVDDSTTAAVTTLIMAVLAFIGAVVVRQKVTPTKKAELQNKAAAKKAVDEANTEALSKVASAVAATIEAPAPEHDLEYDSKAVVTEDGTVSDSDSDDVESESSPETLEGALTALDAANEAKENALTETEKALESVKAEAKTTASTYAARIKNAEQRLAEIKE